MTKLMTEAEECLPEWEISLIIGALMSAAEDCYSPEKKDDYLRLIDKLRGGDDDQQRLDI